MTFDNFLALVTLAIAAAFTPGPNNALVANACAHFGFRRTFPMIAGVGFGTPFMMFCVGIGLGQVFQTSPILREVLRWGGVIILLWFAWKIACSPVTAKATQSAKPHGFLKMVGFQWVNPKALAMAFSVTSQFMVSDQPIQSLVIISAVFVAVGFGSATTWALFGLTIQRILTSPLRFRIFNITMASLVLLSVIAIAFPELYK
jgi:threonine/homoserine/homoserine lactone efflux protein